MLIRPNLFNVHHWHGWHTTFVFLIKVSYLCLIVLLPSFYFFQVPQERGVSEKLHECCPGSSCYTCTIPISRKKIKKKIGHCCAWCDIFTKFCLFIFLLNEFCNSWIWSDEKLLVFICQWIRKHWSSFKICILVHSFRKKNTIIKFYCEKKSSHINTVRTYQFHQKSSSGHE